MHCSRPLVATLPESPRFTRYAAAAGLTLVGLLAGAAAGHAEHRVRSVSQDFLPTGAPSSTYSSQSSPDGKWIVFVACESGDACYLASSRRFAAPGEEPVELDGPVHGQSFFGWGISFEITGDSRRVVYEANDIPDAENDLWSVAIDGSSAPVRLNPPLLTDESIDDYLITPDGQQVVYLHERPGPDRLVRVAIGGGSVTTLDEGDSIRPYLFPPASGNPRLLYFIDTDDNNQLEILTTYLSSPLPFALWGGQLRAGIFISSVEFTPDGGQVVLIADQQVDDRDDLWSIRTDSANTLHKLNPALVGEGDVITFDLSSDGRAVFMADAEVDERFELWSAPIDASSTAVKISGSLVSGGDVRNPRVSGEWVAYIADAAVDERDELWSVPADGHEAPTRRSDTVPSGRDVFSFRFTPSGSRLVYRANLGPVDQMDLYTTSTFGFTSHVRLTNRNPFAPDPYSVRSYTLSPDSQRVAFIVEPDTNWDGVAMEQNLSNPVTTPEILLEVTGVDATEYFAGYLPDSQGLLTDVRLQDGDRREVFLLEAAIFIDGFGSGDRTAWSASVP
jgi:Tol biopolymer transport system component